MAVGLGYACCKEESTSEGWLIHPVDPAENDTNTSRDEDEEDDVGDEGDWLIADRVGPSCPQHSLPLAVAPAVAPAVASAEDDKVDEALLAQVRAASAEDDKVDEELLAQVRAASAGHDKGDEELLAQARADVHSAEWVTRQWNIRVRLRARRLQQWTGDDDGRVALQQSLTQAQCGSREAESAHLWAIAARAGARAGICRREAEDARDRLTRQARARRVALRAFARRYPRRCPPLGPAPTPSSTQHDGGEDSTRAQAARAHRIAVLKRSRAKRQIRGSQAQVQHLTVASSFATELAHVHNGVAMRAIAAAQRDQPLRLRGGAPPPPPRRSRRILAGGGGTYNIDCIGIYGGLTEERLRVVIGGKALDKRKAEEQRLLRLQELTEGQRGEGSATRVGG